MIGKSIDDLNGGNNLLITFSNVNDIEKKAKRSFDSEKILISKRNDHGY